MANYPIPPWLAQRTDYGALALARSRAQADLNMQSQRIAQQQQQFEQQMEMRRMSMEAEQRIKEKQLKMQSEVAKARLDVEMAYNQVKAGLESSRIQAANRKIDMDYGVLADKMQRRLKFEQAFSDNMQASNNPEESFRKAWFEQGATAGIPYPAGARNLPVAGQRFEPEVFERGGVKFARTSDKHVQVIPGENVRKPSVFKLTLPNGQDVQGVQMGGSMRIVPPTAGSSRIEPAGMGMSRIVTPGKNDRIIRTPQFKFSRQQELTRLESGDFAGYLDPEADISGLTKTFKSQIMAARKRHDELLRLREEEMKEFKAMPVPEAAPEEDEEPYMGEQGMDEADFDFDPDSNSVLPNQ